MENWGAILTFERSLLIDPAITSPAAQDYMWTAQAHEVAHQWFGDIVTMAWWDDLWLNEGFASWMETKAKDHFHPEWSGLLTRVNGREGAMALDSFATTHPVIQRIRTVEESNTAFDSIAYSKGEAVISMLEAYAGEDTWRQGHPHLHRPPQVFEHHQQRPVARGRGGRRRWPGDDRPRLHAPARRAAGARRSAMRRRQHRAQSDAERIQPRPQGASRREPAALARAPRGPDSKAASECARCSTAAPR
jgi:hypothetical protein